MNLPATSAVSSAIPMGPPSSRSSAPPAPDAFAHVLSSTDSNSAPASTPAAPRIGARKPTHSNPRSNAGSLTQTPLISFVLAPASPLTGTPLAPPSGSTSCGEAAPRSDTPDFNLSPPTLTSQPADTSPSPAPAASLNAPKTGFVASQREVTPTSTGTPETGSPQTNSPETDTTQTRQITQAAAPEAIPPQAAVPPPPSSAQDLPAAPSAPPEPATPPSSAAIPTANLPPSPPSTGDAPAFAPTAPQPLAPSLVAARPGPAGTPESSLSPAPRPRAAGSKTPPRDTATTSSAAAPPSPDSAARGVTRDTPLALPKRALHSEEKTGAANDTAATSLPAVPLGDNPTGTAHTAADTAHVDLLPPPSPLPPEIAGGVHVPGSPLNASPGPSTPAESVASNNVEMGRLVRSVSGSELHVGVHSAEFGEVTIRAALGREQLSAHILTENERLGSALSTHLSSLQESLDDRFGKGLSLKTTVSVGSGGMTDAGADSSRQRDSSSSNASTNPAANFAARHPNAVSAGPESIERAPATTPIAQTRRIADRLSIRI